ncbi:MAG: GIY-YIG nuclease family protein [Allosphingosinicella sp.]
MREIILGEIRRIAEASGGKPPGIMLFRRETGIPDGKWLGIYWARWSDVLGDAGYPANKWRQKLDSPELLRKLATVVRERGAIPARAELAILRRSDPSVPNQKTLSAHFGRHTGLVAALRTYCAEHEDFADVLTLLPQLAVSPAPKQQRDTAEGWVYLLKSGSHYKIGRSDQLEARVKKISIALPEATALVHAIRTDDPPGIEAYWHRRFNDRRANGEWFTLTANDVAAFCRRKFQ